MSKKKEILSQMKIFTFATQLTQFITLIAGILTRNFLGTVQMGMWSTLQIILEYSKYSTLGTTKATSREIPYYLGKKDEKTSTEIKNLVASFSTLTSLVTSLGIILFAFWKRSEIGETFFLGLLGVAVIVILQRINNLMIALLRAYKKFELASKQMVISSIVNAALVAILAYKFKIYGFMVAVALSFTFNIVYISLHHQFNFKFLLSRKIGGLISFGFPLMILGLMTTLLGNIDRMFIIGKLGFEAMGLYSVAVMAYNFLGRLPNAMGIIMIPHLNEKYGENDNAEDIKRYIEKAAFAFSTITPILIGIAWILIPFFVKLVLPQYVEGIRSAQLLGLGAYFVALGLTYGNFMITLKKHLILFPIALFVIFCAASLNYIVIEQGYGIRGVALATVATGALHFILLFAVSAKRLYSFREGIFKFGTLFLKFGFLVVVLKTLEFFWPLNASLTQSALYICIFLIAQSPFILKLLRAAKS